MRLLLARGARQDLRNALNETAVHLAIDDDHVGTVVLSCALPGAAAALAL